MTISAWDMLRSCRPKKLPTGLQAEPGDCLTTLSSILTSQVKSVSSSTQLLNLEAYRLIQSCLKALSTNIVGVLLCFRQYPVAVSVDIVKMFHQVRVRPADRSALRFLWRNPGSTDPPDEYQMNVQIFGATSSPAICAHVLRQAARDAGDNSVAAVKHVVDNFYVDNWLPSFSSVDEAISSVRMMNTVLSRAGFELSQWASSHKEVLVTVPKNAATTVDMDLDAVPIERALGLQWHSDEDNFMLRFSIQKDCRTKRQVLCAIASIFDPLGFVEPVILQAKIIMQAIWRAEIDWDDVLPDDIMLQWTKWVDSFSTTRPIAIARCVSPRDRNWWNLELHVFADASEVGFGAVAYLRYETTGGACLSFVMAKSRVAPVKPLTIPRMELNGALMAVRLATTIRRELRMHIERIIFHLVSATVLRWIHSTAYRFHTYVRNRVVEIHELSAPNQWKYVPSSMNPADDCSRGMFAAQLHKDHRFLRGPDFLLEPPNHWPCRPEFEISADAGELDVEVRGTKWIGTLQLVTDRFDTLLRKIS